MVVEDWSPGPAFARSGTSMVSRVDSSVGWRDLSLNEGLDEGA